MFGSFARFIDRLRRLPEIDGYEHPELLDVIHQKARDYRPDREWPEMRGVSSALDFGGGCGHHYKEAALASPQIRWAVVETPGMVARAADLATDRLRFFDNVEAARDWLGQIDVMHSNGAVQYTPDPLKTVQSLCAVGAERLIWHRVALSGTLVERKLQSSLLSDNGPGKAPPGLANKTVKYTVTATPEAAFLAAHSGYELTERGTDWFKFRKMSGAHPHQP
jgi:putative methyltransferase (TIGR04325 family)